MSTNYVPAIKAKMGDWNYYITKMKFGEVAKEVKRADEIHPDRELDQLIQRDLSTRVASMTKFLLQEKQRFYGALVVAVYKGNPRFHPVKISEEHKIVDEVENDFGLLQFDGSQTFFALDGQHRLESIKAACDENVDLKGEEISVIVLQHADTKAGMVRTRRLFTKLNRYAKPTDAKTNIAIDEDDCVAIVSRWLIRDFAIIKGLIKIDKASKQLGPGKAERDFLATLMSFYECNLELAQAFDKDIVINQEFLRRRPEEEFLEKLQSFFERIWTEILEGIPLYGKIVKHGAKPGDARGGENGGIIWVRPNMQLILSTVLARAMNEGMTAKAVIRKLAKLPSHLNEEPWANLIFNPGTQRIIGGKAERDLLVDIVLLAIGGQASRTKKAIHQEYGSYYDRKSKVPPVIA